MTSRTLSTKEYIQSQKNILPPIVENHVCLWNPITTTGSVETKELLTKLPPHIVHQILELLTYQNTAVENHVLLPFTTLKNYQAHIRFIIDTEDNEDNGDNKGNESDNGASRTGLFNPQYLLFYSFYHTEHGGVFSWSGDGEVVKVGKLVYLRLRLNLRNVGASSFQFRTKTKTKSKTNKKSGNTIHRD